MAMVYEPREDSELIARCIPHYKYLTTRVLDMGTGSGYLASIAAIYAKEVIGVDINPKAIEHAKLHHPLPNVSFFVSDLFENITGKFTLVTFNAPYLPKEEGLTDPALDGGFHGWEIIERFLNQAKEHLEDKGIILLLFSSLTNQEKVEELIEKNALTFKCIAKQQHFFEELFVYELSSS